MPQYSTVFLLPKAALCAVPPTHAFKKPSETKNIVREENIDVDQTAHRSETKSQHLPRLPLPAPTLLLPCKRLRTIPVSTLPPCRSSHTPFHVYTEDRESSSKTAQQMPKTFHQIFVQNRGVEKSWIDSKRSLLPLKISHAFY